FIGLGLAFGALGSRLTFVRLRLTALRAVGALAILRLAARRRLRAVGVHAFLRRGLVPLAVARGGIVGLRAGLGNRLPALVVAAVFRLALRLRRLRPLLAV